MLHEVQFSTGAADVAFLSELGASRLLLFWPALKLNNEPKGTKYSPEGTELSAEIHHGIRQGDDADLKLPPCPLDFLPAKSVTRNSLTRARKPFQFAKQNGTRPSRLRSTPVKAIRV